MDVCGLEWGPEILVTGSGAETVLMVWISMTFTSTQGDVCCQTHRWQNSPAPTSSVG